MKQIMANSGYFIHDVQCPRCRCGEGIKVGWVRDAIVIWGSDDPLGDSIDIIKEEK